MFKNGNDYDVKLPHHNLGKPAWNKGICHLSDEARKRISEANLGKTSPLKGKPNPKHPGAIIHQQKQIR